MSIQGNEAILNSLSEHDIQESSQLIKQAPEITFLNRITYGPTVEELDYIKKIGIPAYLEEQLHPDEMKDSDVQDRLNKLKIQIKYGEKADKYPAMDEYRPLTFINATIDQLWPLAENKAPMANQEKQRPAEEVRAASWIRAVYSKYQLREIMVEFWHNHFNVNAFGDNKISATFPVYDRDVIRKNCFGNFRGFLEDVAKSTAMLYFLDNFTSKASPANENYARELFELHTLGSDFYFNNLYNRWKEVPGALTGKPIGYIDEDVYEAARAFTGWTIADGTKIGKGDVLPDNGSFYYYDGWHDNYQKRILGVDFDPNQSPLADGKKVLDLVAYHPATAKHLSKKLCIRFISDSPSESILTQTAAVWIKYNRSPNQIAHVLRFIFSSPEFKASAGKKVKRPFEFIASVFRTINADFTPNNNLTGMLNQMGYFHFQWPSPTGHPDKSSYWLNTNAMIARWNAAIQVISKQNKLAIYNFRSIMPDNVKTPEQIAAFWSNRILHKTKSSDFLSSVAGFLASGKTIKDPMDSNSIDTALPSMIALIMMSPDFQLK